MSNNTEVLIVGGGIIGLLTAKELIQQDVKTVVVDKSEPGEEASWAGGGIVSPLYPWTYSSSITALSSWAQQYYPSLVKELAEQTGIDPQLNDCGLLMLAPPNIAEAQRWGRENQKATQIFSAQQVIDREPNVAPQSDENLWWPHTGNVRNPRLLRSLKAYLGASKHCVLEANSKVVQINKTGATGVEVVTKTGSWNAQKVIVCAGAWSQRLLQTLGVQSQIEVSPVKGQMLIFEPQPGLINSIIMLNGKYLIPRLDGRILVGSTLEFDDFDKTTSAEARELLLQSAHSMVPNLKNAKVEAHWAGLRPGTAAGVPYIGKMPGWDNLYLNAGHFRNGLVLAPASARLMCNLILQQKPIIDPSSYDPARARILEPMH